MRLALVVSELESRGESLAGIRFGLLPILRKIAAGTLLPECVVLYAGEPAALKKIAAMGMAEQQRVASREVIVDGSAAQRPTANRPAPPRGYVDLAAGSRGAGDRPNIAAISKLASHKDVAEMACNLVTGHEQPDAVLSELLKGLKASRQVSQVSRRAIDAAMLVLSK